MIPEVSKLPERAEVVTRQPEPPHVTQKTEVIGATEQPKSIVTEEDIADLYTEPASVLSEDDTQTDDVVTAAPRPTERPEEAHVTEVQKAPSVSEAAGSPADETPGTDGASVHAAHIVEEQTTAALEPELEHTALATEAPPPLTTSGPSCNGGLDAVTHVYGFTYVFRGEPHFSSMG